jgi:hypothetical protein
LNRLSWRTGESSTINKPGAEKYFRYGDSLGQ